jgi:hypothetical protein
LILFQLNAASGKEKGVLTNWLAGNAQAPTTRLDEAFARPLGKCRAALFIGVKGF